MIMENPLQTEEMPFESPHGNYSHFHYNLVVAVDDEKSMYFSEHLADNALLHPQMFEPSSINACTELCTDLLNLSSASVKMSFLLYALAIRVKKWSGANCIQKQK